jgi:hypothetical protein
MTVIDLCYVGYKCFASVCDLKGTRRQLALMAQLNCSAVRVPFVVQSLQRIAQILHLIIRSACVGTVWRVCELQ